MSHIYETNQEYKSELKNNEIQIRGANILRAAESLMKLVSDLKEHLIIHDFYAINCEQDKFKLSVEETVNIIDRTICRLWSSMLRNLEKIEIEYYTMPYPDLFGLRMTRD